MTIAIYSISQRDILSCFVKSKQSQKMRFSPYDKNYFF